MKMSLILGLLINTVVASAQVNFIDRSGTGLVARDKQRAAIFIVGEAVEMIKQNIPNSNKNSQVTCETGFCVIGQFGRSGALTPFQEKFAAPDYFSKMYEHMQNPRYLVEAGFYEDNMAKLYAYPTQCQEANLKPRNTVTIKLEGRAAEQLYNFITNKPEKGIRLTSFEKSDTRNFFYCEKKPSYHPEDIDEETGRLRKDAPYWDMEYDCEFEVDQAGQLVRRRDCHIYGGAVSAGGN